MADGCSGQNKNTTLIGMCCKWLASEAPMNVQSLEVIFPMVGHSFLPADRVFGNIERDIKKLEVITQPEDYLKIFSKIGTVVHVGEGCSVYDWKESVKNILKLPGSWHFPFQLTKRFYLKKSNNSGNILVRGEVHYMNDLQVFKGIAKRGKAISMIIPDKINSDLQQVNNLKIVDVNNLLTKHFGNNWRNLGELKFYEGIINTNHQENSKNQEELAEQQLRNEEEPTCEYIPEIPSVLV
ncbi:hypothetical protein JTB14_035087 [Gonioctena quinquepunctata]|nr:hypothetical protein JTB14_035087 [Gonioctena quinquepunctata]